MPGHVLAFCKHSVGLRGLRALHEEGAEICAVVLPASERGSAWYSEALNFARESGALLLETSRLSKDDRAQAQIRDLSPDIGFTMFFTHVIPGPVIQACRNGIINFHPSLLPAYRGPHPVNWAIIRGEWKHGVTTHFVTDVVDGGPIVLRDEFPIGRRDTNLTVMSKVEAIVESQVRRTFRLYREGRLRGEPQAERDHTYFPFRTPDDGRVRWSEMDAEAVYNLARALQPPLYGAFFDWDDRRLVIRWCEPRPEIPGRCELPGTILQVNERSILVQAVRGLVEIMRLEEPGVGEIAPGKFKGLLTPGDRFL